MEPACAAPLPPSLIFMMHAAPLLPQLLLGESAEIVLDQEREQRAGIGQEKESVSLCLISLCLSDVLK